MYLHSLLEKNIMDKVDNVSEYHYQCKLIWGDKNFVLLIQGTFEDSTLPAALKVLESPRQPGLVIHNEF